MPKAVFENVEELSLSDLSAVLGGQSAPQGQKEQNDFVDALKDVGSLLVPFAAPLVNLAHATDRYLKVAYEHQYPTVSDHHAQQAEQHKADHAKQEQADREHQLQGSKPTSAGDVAVWLDATNPGPPPDFSIPTYLTEPPREAEISIEPYTGSWGY